MIILYGLFLWWFYATHLVNDPGILPMFLWFALMVDWAIMEFVLGDR